MLWLMLMMKPSSLPVARLLLLLPFPSKHVACQTALFASHCKVDNRYEPCSLAHHIDEPLHRVLCKIDSDTFPSPSQARKAIQHGRLLVLQSKDYISGTQIITNNTILELGKVAESTTVLQENDIVAIRSRLPNDYYPQSFTNYVDPPYNALDMISDKKSIVFEDDHIAIVNKPEGMDTIGEKRKDLQSALPFMLHPPKMIPAKQNSRKATQNCYLPRPIHRLDRRTSGCVLVAKSEIAMKKFSRLFSTRQIQKNYCAITFGEPKQPDDESECIDIDGKAYSIIDYPIDGKDAVTLWRVVTTTISPTWGEVSLLHLLPKTGRNHQIRRHLSYCLLCPIVGDSKYDGGGELAKESRELGMFLCSNSIEFEHVMLCDENSTVSANIPLPDKFYEILGLDREGDVII